MLHRAIATLQETLRPHLGLSKDRAETLALIVVAHEARIAHHVVNGGVNWGHGGGVKRGHSSAGSLSTESMGGPRARPNRSSRSRWRSSVSRQMPPAIDSTTPSPVAPAITKMISSWYFTASAGSTPERICPVIIHGADFQDRDGAPEVLKAILYRFPWLRHVFADGGYAGPKLRAALKGLSSSAKCNTCRVEGLEFLGRVGDAIQGKHL